jgi:DNA-binding MarR family transcriptional regulator
MAERSNTRLVIECQAAAREVFSLLRQNSGPEWLSLDLTMGQLKALITLHRLGPQAVGELGRRLGLSEPAASLLVDRLEERGHVRRERDGGDRRRCLISLSDAGKDLTSRLSESREEQVARWLTALERDELEGLLHGFRGLLRVAPRLEAED